MNILYVIDLDGTVVDAAERLRKAGPEPARVDKDAYTEWLGVVQSEQLLKHDRPVPGMIDMVWALVKAADVVFLTAREAKWRPITQEWIRKNQIPPIPLYMRPNDSYEETHEFKRRAIREIVHDLHGAVDEVVVIDDDPSGKLQEVCRKEYWTFLKACSGS